MNRRFEIEHPRRVARRALAVMIVTGVLIQATPVQAGNRTVPPLSEPQCYACHHFDI